MNEIPLKKTTNKAVRKKLTKMTLKDTDQKGRIDTGSQKNRWDYKSEWKGLKLNEALDKTENDERCRK